MAEIQLIECPRDAMQGWHHFIPTEKKISYINALLKVGFHTIDFGSFVSPKSIPQMADTRDVIRGLDLSGTSSRLLAIVANTRGAEEASAFDEIHYLGFPFSVSPTFQLRNTNSTQEESLKRIDEIHTICKNRGKEIVIYLSMGFGNPYGDTYNEEVLFKWANEMVARDIQIISLADTVGIATPEQIKNALHTLVPEYTDQTIGVHLHSSPANWKAKLQAASDAGCKRFDGALRGIGGCPMAQDTLVGNMDMLKMVDFFQQNSSAPHINQSALYACASLADEIFI